MSERERDYLFDLEGEPDPEIARLEGLLAPLAYRGVAPRLPARRSRRPFVVAAALTAMAAAIVAIVVARPWRPAWIDTERAGVHLAIGDIGSVELVQHTRARVVASGPERHALELVRGTLRATIDAPPRRFVVVTPHAVVTDLGCAFEITVDEAGRGTVVVTSGRVGVASDGAPEVVVPAGARVELSEHGVSAPSVPAERSQVPAPTQAPTPTPTPTHAPIPIPIPIPIPSQTSATTSHHAAHATSKPAATPKATKTKTPPHASTPTPAHAPSTPKQPPTKVEHDSLKELQRSVE